MRIPIPIYVFVPLFRAFGDEIFARHFAHLAVELDLVAGDLAVVYDAQHLVLEVWIFHERDFVSFHGAFGDLRLAELRLRGTGQLLAVHFEIVGVVLHADLGIDGGGPLAGHAGGESGRAYGRHNEWSAHCKSADSHGKLLSPYYTGGARP